MELEILLICLMVQKCRISAGFTDWHGLFNGKEGALADARGLKLRIENESSLVQRCRFGGYLFCSGSAATTRFAIAR